MSYYMTDNIIDLNKIRLTNAVDSFNKGINSLNKHEIEHVAKHIAYNNTLKECTTIYEQSKIDYNAELEQFLTGYCELTRRNYAYGLKCAQDFTTKPCYFWDHNDATEYVKHLDSKYSVSSVMAMLSAIKSFRSFVLKRNNMNNLHIWPSMSEKLRKSYRFAILPIPTEKDVEAIIRFTHSNRLRLWVALMFWNGLRSDGVRNICFHDDLLTFSTTSKGYDYSGELHPKVLPHCIYRGTPFKHVGRPNYGTAITTLTRRAKKNGLIAHEYSPHTFRHACAIRVWRQTESLEKVARVLGHKNITTTEIYLKSILRPQDNECRYKLDCV